jgi:hypothetical protein
MKVSNSEIIPHNKKKKNLTHVDLPDHMNVLTKSAKDNFKMGWYHHMASHTANKLSGPL